MRTQVIVALLALDEIFIGTINLLLPLLLLVLLYVVVIVLAVCGGSKKW